MSSKPATLDPKECSTLRSTLPKSPSSGRLTGRKRERLLGQTACSHAGVPRPAALPAARHLLACSQIVHYNHQEEVFLPSQSVDQPGYNNDSSGGGGGNNGLCDVTTDGGCSPLSLQFTNSSLSLSRGFRYEGEQGGQVINHNYSCRALCVISYMTADNEWAVNPRMAGITESPCESEKEEEEMVERQDKEGAAMGEWGIFSHPAEKGRHAWTGGGGRGNQGIKALDLVISLTPLTYKVASNFWGGAHIHLQENPPCPCMSGR